jgi:hypothetical protein
MCIEGKMMPKDKDQCKRSCTFGLHRANYDEVTESETVAIMKVLRLT